VPRILDYPACANRLHWTSRAVSAHDVHQGVFVAALFSTADMTVVWCSPCDARPPRPLGGRVDRWLTMGSSAALLPQISFCAYLGVGQK
jgi:hypothetical protein